MLPAYAPEHIAAVRRLGRKQEAKNCGCLHVADDEEREEEVIDTTTPAITMYPIDYEVDSKKVRNYRTNDPNSVIGAIVEHVHEILIHHDIQMYYGYENVSLVLGALMCMCAGLNFIIKGEDFSETKWVYLYMAGAFVVLFIVQRVVASLEGSNTFVITTPSSVGKTAASQKGKGGGMAAVVERVLERREWIFKRCLVQLAQPTEGEEEEDSTVEEPDNGSSLSATPLPALSPQDSAIFNDLTSLFTGRATRFRIRQPVQSVPVFEIVIEVLDPSTVTFYKKPLVTKQVTRLYAFSHFFDEDGFIFIPRIKAEVISMLKEAVAGGVGAVGTCAKKSGANKGSGGGGAKNRR